MTKKKKIIIGISVTLGALLLAFVLLIVWAFFGDDIKIGVRARLEAPSARSAAAKYIEEKYGEKVGFSDYKVLTDSSGFMFASSYFVGIEFIGEDYSVRVYIDDKSKEISDNKQYGEICSAVKEHYLYDDALGSSHTEESFSLDFDFSGYRNEFTSEYFDGDIEDFLSKTNTRLFAEITYEGYPEKYGEYRELLTDKLEHILSDFDSRSSSVYFYVHNPDIDLPEVKNKYENSSRIYHIPRYEEYMELIATGYIDGQKARVAQTDWYDIDSFTAISCEVSPVASDSDFIFREVDLSDNTAAYRGVYMYDDRANENVLQIRDAGYEVDFTDKKEKGITVFLRLDREHYNITENTVPLLIADGEGNWEGKRLYTSIGYGKYDSKEDDWYYLDNDYLYLYIDGTYIDLWDAYLTFSDIE